MSHRGDSLILDLPRTQRPHSSLLATAPPAQRLRKCLKGNQHFQLLPQEPQVPSAPSCLSFCGCGQNWEMPPMHPEQQTRSSMAELLRPAPSAAESAPGSSARDVDVFWTAGLRQKPLHKSKHPCGLQGPSARLGLRGQGARHLPSSSPHSSPRSVAFQHPQTPPRCCGAFPQPCASSQGLDKHLLP